MSANLEANAATIRESVDRIDGLLATYHQAKEDHKQIPVTLNVSDMPVPIPDDWKDTELLQVITESIAYALELEFVKVLDAATMANQAIHAAIEKAREPEEEDVEDEQAPSQTAPAPPLPPMSTHPV